MFGRRQRIAVAVIGAAVIWLVVCGFFVIAIDQGLLR